MEFSHHPLEPDELIAFEVDVFLRRVGFRGSGCVFLERGFGDFLEVMGLLAGVPIELGT